MAAKHGKGGSATFTGLTFELRDWSFDATADVAESTVMGAASKTYLAGFLDWTATCELVLPAAGVGVLATVLGAVPAALVLLTGTGGRKYTGDAICISVGASSSTSDVGSATYNFQGSGLLVETAV